MADTMNDFQAPCEPPPLLDFEQIKFLAYHGWLPLELPELLVTQINSLSSESKLFFDRSKEDKGNLYPSSHGTERGYYHVFGEKEYITFRRRESSVSSLETQVQAVWCQAAQLLHRALCDLSRAGGYDLQGWDHLVDGSLGLPREDSNLEEIISLMRLFRYLPEAGFAEEHVDIGLLTLCIGDGQGLQVLDQDTKEYVDAAGPTILIGDTARALLRGRVRAGMHRVVSNPNGRFSVVFALRPNLSGVTDLTLFGGEDVIRTKELFYRIKGRKYNINATKNIREKQRKEIFQTSHEHKG